jgi:hypothetical protein
MVTVKNVQERKSNEGKTFLVLELEAGLEIATSKATGKPYATTRRCSIPCTMDKESARQLIGTALPGTIEKVSCEPYDYQIPDSGETVTLDYSYAYVNPSVHLQENGSSKMAVKVEVN